MALVLMLDLLYTLCLAVPGCLPVDRPLRLDVGKIILSLSAVYEHLFDLLLVFLNRLMASDSQQSLRMYVVENLLSN